VAEEDGGLISNADNGNNIERLPSKTWKSILKGTRVQFSLNLRAAYTSAS
jgi:hypothetical protein